jgi:hypothetical protein
MQGSDTDYYNSEFRPFSRCTPVIPIAGYGYLIVVLIHLHGLFQPVKSPVSVSV